MRSLRFHSLAHIAAMHRDQIMRYGGTPGIRDTALFASTAAIPRLQSNGIYCHPSVADMASAYLFHTITSRPFVDGNRRVGVVAAIMFLYLNGYKLNLTEDDVFNLADAVSSGTMSKSEVAVLFSAHSFNTQT